ncbi:unnamed protein product [Peniophora sp. CBMAI 1063]|nr:unnamed protein product [Peniophora sp. CBMAI 1063]
MVSEVRVLDADQVHFLTSVLAHDFEPFLWTADPLFTGFGAVSKWVADRKNNIVNFHPLFATPEEEEKKAFRQAIDRFFRDHYHCLRFRGGQELKKRTRRSLAGPPVNRKIGRPKHGQRVKDTHLYSLPSPVPGERNTFASCGYKFKISKPLQTRWYFHWDHYVENGGRIIKACEFNQRMEIPAMAVIVRDPEWLANQEGMHRYVVSRPWP